MPDADAPIDLAAARVRRASAGTCPDGDRWAQLHAVEPAHPGVRQIGPVDVARLRRALPLR